MAYVSVPKDLTKVKNKVALKCYNKVVTEVANKI